MKLPSNGAGFGKRRGPHEEPGSRVISRYLGRSGAGGVYPLACLSRSDLSALSEMRELAACLSGGVAELARRLGLRRGTLAPALSGLQANRPHTVLAAWAVWCAANPNHAEKLIVRTVTARGIRVDRSWFAAPELARYVGLQVVAHRNGPDHLIVYAGRPLAAVAKCLRDQAQRQLPLPFRSRGVKG